MTPGNNWRLVFVKDTRLHRQIGRLIHRVLTRWTASQIGCHRNRKEEREKARPGIIKAVQSFGAGLKSHVHYHILISDGVWFPDGSYYALGHWDQASLLSQLRHSILKSLVARKCLQLETARLLESWPLDRSGFSAFVGDPICQPTDRPRVERLLNYIFRPSMPLKHLSYVESTGQVRFSPPRAAAKVWDHAFEFLADWVQHIPRARQHQVSYAGWFANALGKLNPKKEGPVVQGNADEPEKTNTRWVKWRTLILRCWAVDPELCPKCGKEMKRSKALSDHHELRILKNLGIRLYPVRPRSPPAP